MANADRPFGMRPFRHRNGAPYSGSGNFYFVPASDTTALFVGDPVVKSGTSNTAAVSAIGVGTRGIGELPAVTRATAGDSNYITGVVVAVMPETHSSLQYRASSTARVVKVADDPDLVFLIQDDGGGSPAATSIGLNAVLINTHSGSTTTGIAAAEMDFGTSVAPAADDTYQLTIQRLHEAPDNEMGDNAVWEVRINRHTEAHGVIGI